MCADCGCGDESGTRLTLLDQHHPHDQADHVHDHADHPHDQADHVHDQADHVHDQAHDSPHGPAHPHPHDRPPSATTRTIDLEQAVLAKNDRLAEVNRHRLREHAVTALNLMSSPGSGKTSLLERTIRELAGHRAISVIEGDQETLLDAERIRATGCRVVQINTGAGCHLDADMLARAIAAIEPTDGSLLFIENVGNLVCPALFDLGESARVVVISVTEGDDKPLKYPQMFASADLVVINKIDLLPHVDFDLPACAARARSLNPGLEVISLSVKTGEGMDRWHAWLNR